MKENVNKFVECVLLFTAQKWPFWAAVDWFCIIPASTDNWA